jgi:hypothetical protein
VIGIAYGNADPGNESLAADVVAIHGEIARVIERRAGNAGDGL